MAAPYPPIPRSFFGGAIQASLPASFKDLAPIRQVPDHQECWLDDARDALFVLECLEHDAALDAGAAARRHWGDLCCDNESTVCDEESFRWMLDPAAVRGLPETAAVVRGVGFQRVKMGRSVDVGGYPRSQEERHVRLELGLVRLPSVQTDLLLTLSTPCAPNPKESASPEQSADFRTILTTLQIRDWSLFG